MSVKSFLRSTYGNGITEITSYERCLEKLSRFRNHVIFNAKCQREGIIPESVRIKSPIDTERGRRIAEKAGHQFVNERLRLANYRVRQLEDEAKWREIGLRRQLADEDAERVIEMSKKNGEIVFEATKKRQRKKYNELRGRQTDVQNKAPSDKKWVINLSSRKLTEHEESALQKGLNFAVAPKSIPRTELIASVETAIRRNRTVDEETAERTRAAIASIIRHANPPRPNLQREELQALSTLRKDEDITILQADKGNATVILNTDDYEKKAAAIVDHPPFKRINHNPTAKNEKRINDTLKRMAEIGDIDEETVRQLRVPANGTRIPLFYGTVKIHKTDLPLRPVVSTIGSATYNIAKFVNRALTQYVRMSPSFIENTPHFIEEIESMQIQEDEVMVSFDVRSLFTSVPTIDAVRAIEEFLDADKTLKQRTGMNKEAIMKLVHLCLSATHFRFRNKYYYLEDGLPMGSPASQAIANIFMCKFEQNALSSFTHSPKVWLRFVDDVFSIVKKSQVENLLRHLNTQHPSISFTVEVETKNKLPFMDVTTHRIGNNIRIDVYRKPTHTGRYLHFESNHPTSVKKSVVRSLRNRTKYITLGDENTIQAEENRIKCDLEANGYPPSFIKKATSNSTRNIPAAREEPITLTTAAIPYIRGTSEAISRILAPLRIRTVMKPATLKWSLMKRAKDSISADETAGVIYALGCTDCPQVYIGETARTARQRSREHKCHTNTGHTELSAIARHAHEEAHTIHWKPRVLAKETDNTKRKIKEALAIRRLEKDRGKDKIMNQDSGLELSRIWLDLA